MLALLPLLGGLLVGWLAPRRTAIVLQLLFYALALTALTASAPDHGGAYRDALWLAPVLALLSAGSLLIGLRLAGRGSGA
jgi:hypothetical protein